MNLPDEYLAKMKKLLANQYDDYLNSFNHDSYHGLRVNTNKISIEDFLKICPFKLERIPWTSDGFYYNENDKPSKHPYYYAGLYYLQEPSAMLPGEVLNIQDNDIVLDACAAPGGKSTKIACKLKNTGVLVSNDISYSRAQGLLRNVERFGIKNTFVVSEDISKLKDKYPNFFTKILIDAPCSGEGMFRKDNSLIKSWLERGNDYYANIQKEIISAAIEMLKDGGELVYSTCTFDESEDEDIIQYALDKYPNLKPVDINICDGFTKGKNSLGVKLYPHLIKGEGHYVCHLKKSDTSLINKTITSITKTINNCHYLVPNIDTSGLRVLRSGLLLDDLKGEPSQALAMSLTINDYPQIINLSINDSRVIKYLKGETINVSEYQYEGYVLICVDNYPLGFGKLSKGIFKNKIDKGWLYQ